MDMLLIVPIVLPMLAGMGLLASSFREGLREAEGGRGDPGKDGRIRLLAFVGAVLGISAVFALAAAWTGEREVVLFSLLEGIPIFFRIDALGRFFATAVTGVWVLSAVYAFVYMKEEGKEKRFFGFYLTLYGVLMAMDFSGNLVTMYLFYELTTLLSMPLVLHSGSREAVMAALKYLFYSMCGAYGGLFGIFFLARHCASLDFTAGGTLDVAVAQGHEGILLLAVFAALLGFGAKAGMLPLHAWLPAAHPVAPSPASAVLSAIIVKSGVLAVIRVVYYIAGPGLIRGTWVQYAWMTLALATVFLGSMLAFRERGMKKRLAYSTVSQVSYILFGLSLLTADAMTGALLHVAVHAFVKCGLFLAAGVFLNRFGFTRVDQLAGIGKRIPKTMWCYLLLSLALTGIPPTGGFISKWYLAQGALQSDTGTYAWLGPVVLLVSALLTAGYLLPVAMGGFFPGGTAERLPESAATVGKMAGKLPETAEAEATGKMAATVAETAGKLPQEAAVETAKKVAETVGKLPEAEKGLGMAGGPSVPGHEIPLGMLLPILALTVAAVFLGVFPNPLIRYAAGIAQSVLGRSV